MTASGGTGQERQAIEETAARLFAKLSLDPDPCERAAIYRWIAEADSHAIAFAQVEAAWQHAERLKAIPCEKLRMTAATPDGAVSGNDRKILVTRRRIFAGAVAAAASLALAFPFLPTQRGGWQEYSTGVGERRDIQLADGSILHLNTGTRADVRLGEASRVVRLRAGEASFDVAHDQARPFDVEAQGSVLRAVGTSFNVRIRDKAVELTVAEGRVAVRRAARTLDILKAGSGAVIGADSVVPRRFSPNEMSRNIAWQRDRIELNGDSIREAVAEFNRYRSAPIVIADERVGALRIGGRFNTREAENFVVAIESSLPIQAQKSADGTIVLRFRDD